MKALLKHKSFLNLVLFLISFYAIDTTNLYAQNFQVRFQAGQRGGIVYVSNSSLTRTDGYTAVNDLPPSGTGNGNNNDHPMGYIDVDGNDPDATFSSSSANLNLIACSQISFVGLYWGGSADHAKNINNVKIKLPGAAAYTNLTSDITPFNFNDGTHEYYQSFKDITSLITAQSIINGTYTVANVVGGADPTARMGGWTMVVVYQNENKPFRNLTVFDGFKGMASSGSPLDISISGFLTPQTGPVNLELGFVSYEGDRATVGDYMNFNTKPVSDASHIANNMFNSSITYNGSVVTTRNPAYSNTLGYDASIVFLDNSAFGYIGHNQTTATVRVGTNGDGYALGVLTTAIDVIYPYFTFTHSYTNNTRPGFTPDAGDELELMYEVSNIGNDDSRLTYIEDELPPLLHYVNNSLEIETSPGVWVSKTDIASDDQAEFSLNGQLEKVKFRVGTGANATLGGNVAIGQTYRVRCKVKITADCLELKCANGTISNDGSVYYFGVINSTDLNQNFSGPPPVGGACPHTGLMDIAVNVSASCLVPYPDLDYTSACKVIFDPLSLPTRFQVYAPNDFSFSTPLTEAITSGQYVARRTVVNGCPYTFKINITIQPLALTNVMMTPILCSGGTSTVTLAATDGTGAYQYKLDNGTYQNSNVFTNLISGSYTFWVKDGNACEKDFPINISQPATLSLSGNASPILCNGGTSTVTLAATDGTGAYQYKLDNGTYQNSNVFTNLMAGNYTFWVKDGNACEKDFPISITQPATLSLSGNASPILCNGGTSTVTLAATDGTGAYQYKLGNGTYQNSNVFTNLMAGNYTFWVKDGNACEKDFPINISQPAELKSTVEIINTLCKNSADGSVILNVTGGLPPYKYTWNDNSNLNQSSLKQIVAGTYGVRIRDANNCTLILKNTVLSGNCKPLVVNDEFSEKENIQIAGTVASNDLDPDGDLLTFSIVTLPNNGDLVFKSDGTFNYTPPLNFYGKVEFSYQACDQQSLCTNAVVTINVTAVMGNSPPIANDDRFYVNENINYPGTVIANDDDPDKDILTFNDLTQPAHGSIQFKADGSFIYTPNKDYNGTDQFSYKACDPSGNCDDAMVTLIIEPLVTVNLTPAKGDVTEGSKISITAVLTKALQEDVFITLKYEGIAEQGKDYFLLDSFKTIRIPAKQTTTEEKLTVLSLKDDISEGDENVLVSIQKVSSNFTLIGTGSDVTILNLELKLPVIGKNETPDIITVDPFISPNGDGKGNESLLISNISLYPDNEITIFNRWGNEVFTMKGYDNDDHAFKGVANTGIFTNTSKELPDGVYYYVINLLDNGTKKTRKGYFILKK